MENQDFKYQKGKKGRGLVLPRRVAYAARAALFSPVFILERDSLLGKSQPRTSRPSQVMNDICNATNGSGLEVGSKMISALARKQTKEFDRKIQDLESSAKISAPQRAKILEQLRVDGFTKIPAFISENQATNLYNKILSNPGRDRRKVEYTNQNDWLTDLNSPRIDADRESLSAAVNSEALDYASLKLIARDYLNCRPIQLGPNSWTTKPIPSLSIESQDENAMAFHSDSDYFGFLKAFLLLTEVDLDSGPFTFIAGSHLKDRQVQGRLKDSDLGYQESEVRLGTGRPGDLVLAVTTGWHKASIPKKGHRMMVQWLFTNSLFGSATQ